MMKQTMIKSQGDSNLCASISVSNVLSYALRRYLLEENVIPDRDHWTTVYKERLLLTWVNWSVKFSWLCKVHWSLVQSQRNSPDIETKIKDHVSRFYHPDSILAVLVTCIYPNSIAGKDVWTDPISLWSKNSMIYGISFTGYLDIHDYRIDRHRSRHEDLGEAISICRYSVNYSTIG